VQELQELPLLVVLAQKELPLVPGLLLQELQEPLLQELQEPPTLEPHKP
jgi:hypothetical protein